MYHVKHTGLAVWHTGAEVLTLQIEQVLGVRRLVNPGGCVSIAYPPVMALHSLQTSTSIHNHPELWRCTPQAET